jgi:hypothetical protein
MRAAALPIGKLLQLVSIAPKTFMVYNIYMRKITRKRKFLKVVGVAVVIFVIMFFGQNVFALSAYPTKGDDGIYRWDEDSLQAAITAGDCVIASEDTKPVVDGGSWDEVVTAETYICEWLDPSVGPALTCSRYEVEKISTGPGSAIDVNGDWSNPKCRLFDKDTDLPGQVDPTTPDPKVPKCYPGVTVTFDANGGLFKYDNTPDGGRKVLEVWECFGKKYVFPTDPVNEDENIEFVGWFRNPDPSDCSQSITNMGLCNYKYSTTFGKVKATENFTLYAHWDTIGACYESAGPFGPIICAWTKKILDVFNGLIKIITKSMEWRLL